MENKIWKKVLMVFAVVLVFASLAKATNNDFSVTWNYPANNTVNTTSTSITFSYTPIWHDVPDAVCAIFVSPPGEDYYNATPLVNGTINTITHDFGGNGAHEAYATCGNGTGGSNGTDTYDFTIDIPNYSFSAGWDSPANNSVNTSQTITVEYTPVWYDNPLTVCDLVVNGSTIAYNDTPLANDTVNTITYDYGGNGDYESHITCGNGTDSNDSDTIYFTIDVPNLNFNVVWSLPSNNSIHSNQTITVYYIPTWYDVEPNNCSLWVNSSAVAYNDTPLINGTSANGITYDYGADGYYENYVNCANDTDNNWTDTVYFSIISPPASNITDCAELTIPNHTYYLTQNIIDTPMAHCMDIQANNVTLDCEGHTINGDNMSSEYGIFSSSYSDAVIHNCVITDWLTSGIRLESSINTIIYNNTLEYNYDGIDIYPTSDATIYSNHFYNNGDGIDIEGGDSGSLIYNNYFSDYFGEYIDTDNYNGWNTTKQAGTRIFSAGSQIGGNYWGGSGICTGTVMPCEDILNETSCNNQLGCDWFSDGGSYCENSSPMGPAPCWYFNLGGNSTTCNAQLGCSWATGGYSDNCIDANKDGFCDSPYDVYYGTPCTAGVDCSNNTDYLPLSNKYVPPTPPSPGFGGINCTVMNLIVIFSTLAIVIILVVLAYGGQTNPALAMLIVVPMLLVLVIAIMNLVSSVC